MYQIRKELISGECVAIGNPYPNKGKAAECARHLAKNNEDPSVKAFWVDKGDIGVLTVLAEQGRRR